MFQDDPLLVYGTSEQVNSTLDTLRDLGVDRIRVSIFWRLVAPAGDSAVRPAFDATDPAQYPPENWVRYDRLIRAALARGLPVNLNFTSPVPRWAAAPAPRADIQETYAPSVDEFRQFVQAVGTRYGGGYGGLPRVDYWSVWNEPNQAGWLTPQWSPDPRRPSRLVEAAPAAYRALVGAAWQGLADSGHGRDTFLVGETAPQGQKRRRGVTQSIDALRFLRALYCVDENVNVLTGRGAELRGCPGQGASFVSQNPGLFRATGYAHHPYALLTPPSRRSSWQDWVTISDLRRLTRELSRIYRRYGQKPPTRRGVPLYLTEYGYQTKPDPFAVSFSRQAAWTNEAEYLAFRDPRVRALSQFLLVDDAPMAGVDPRKNPRLAWRTFQSGLQSRSGRRKPAYKAYITPIHVKLRRVRRGRSHSIFGMLRPANPARRYTARIQFRARGARRWRTRRQVTVSGPRHYFQARVRVPRTGYVRIHWRDGGRRHVSRPANVTVAR